MNSLRVSFSGKCRGYIFKVEVVVVLFLAGLAVVHAEKHSQTEKYKGDGEKAHIARNYPWGYLWVSAASSDSRKAGSVHLKVFSKDVLVEVRLKDGRRILIAAGYLELDPETGDFTAGDYPFVHATRGGAELVRYEDGVLKAFRFHDGKIQSTGASVPPLREQPSFIDPTILQHRRKQLSTLEERVSVK